MAVEQPAAVCLDPMPVGKNNGMKNGNKIELRNAGLADIDRINSIVAAALNTWQLTKRVKRITLPLYRYHAVDLAYMKLVVAYIANEGIVGVAALEEPPVTNIRTSHSTFTLHGLYVAADRHRQGIGRRLLEMVEDIALSQGADVLLVKARPEAISFFKAGGFDELPTRDWRSDYPHQLHKRFRKPSQFDSIKSPE